jgi:hypothetical protein
MADEGADYRTFFRPIAFVLFVTFVPFVVQNVFLPSP